MGLSLPTFSVGSKVRASDLTLITAAIAMLDVKARFKVRQITTAQSFTTGTWTSVTFNDEVYDTVNGHDNTTNNTRYTVPAGYGGLWLLMGKMSWNSSTTNRRQHRWRVDGTTVIPGTETAQPPASSAPQLPSTTVIHPLTAGQYVEFQVAQDSGGTITSGLFGADTEPWMAGVWLGSSS